MMATIEKDTNVFPVALASWPRGIGGYRGIDYYLIRHAKPVVYGKVDSPLDPEGIQQSKELGLRLGYSFIETSDFPLEFGIYYSPLLRAQETAQIALDSLADLVAREGLKNIHLIPPVREPILYTTGGAEKLIRLGEAIPDNAYLKYMTRDEQELEEMGVEPPSTMLDGIVRNIADINENAKALKDSRRVLANITHETTLGPMVRILLPVNLAPKINFTEGIKIHLGNLDGTVDCEWRGQRFPNYAPENFMKAA